MHAIAAIQLDHGKPEDYVGEHYNKKTWSQAYARMLYPIPDSRLWPKTTYNCLSLLYTKNKQVESSRKLLEVIINQVAVANCQRELL